MNRNATDISQDIFFVHVAGCRLRVKRIDPADSGKSLQKPTLVFLHEGLGCIELWRDFPRAVCAATGCAGLVYDRKGYGGSDPYGGPWPLDYLLKESTVYLPGLLKKCDLEHAVLIGHSDGGTIGLLSAAGNTSRICGVITEAAHIFVETVTLAGIRNAIDAYETGDLKTRLARYHGENTENVFRRWADRWLSPDFFDWNIEAYLPKITCPLLVLQGENDEYGSAAQLQGIAAGVSGSVEAKLVPGCGHVPHVQARNVVLNEIIRFVDSLLHTL
jgi:pimeloyl-ACP methyl ester carboxylesterase